MAGLFTLLEAEGFRNYTSKDVRMMNGRSEGSSAFFYAGRPIDRPTNELPKLTASRRSFIETATPLSACSAG